MYFRKAVSAAAAAVISASMMCVPYVSAAQELKISVDSITAQAGEQFEVNVNLSDVPAAGISGIEFAVKYDSALITVTDVVEGEASKTGASDGELDKEGDLADSSVNGSYSCLSYNINKNNSTVDIIWLTGLDSSYYIRNDGVLLTIKGTVNGNASGKAELEVVPISRSNIDGDNNSIYATVGDDAELSVPEIQNGVISISQDTESDPSVIKGDVNTDGTVDVRDVTLMNQFIVQISDLSDKGLSCGDIIADGKVDLKDLGQLKKYLIKIVDKL